MNNSKASQKKHEYFIYFKFVVQLLMAYLSKEDRAKLQEDFMQLIKIEEELKTTKKNENDLINSINEARYVFADNREYYIMKGIAKTGIIKNQDDGAIDFTRIDINTIKTMVVASGGTLAAVKDELGN
jgi:hypothetical protein